VHAGEIWGDSEHFLPGAEFVERLEQVRPHFRGGHLGCWASGGEKEAHIVLILLSVMSAAWVFEPGRFLRILQKKYSWSRAAIFAVLWAFCRGVLEKRGVS
jgi:hypothetical protein